MRMRPYSSAEKTFMVWFVLIIYTFPTIFVAMCELAGLREAPWYLYAWGGLATVTAFLLPEYPQRRKP